jgi:hypothetical protein
MNARMPQPSRLAGILSEERWDGLPDVFAHDLALDESNSGKKRMLTRPFVGVYRLNQQLLVILMTDFDDERVLSRADVQAPGRSGERDL